MVAPPLPVPGQPAPVPASSVPSYMIPPGRTPKQVEMQRRYAEALMAPNTGPLQGGGWAEMAARALTPAIGGLGEYQAGEAERQGKRGAAAALSSALTGEKDIQPAQLGEFFGNEWADPAQQQLLASVYEQQQKLHQPDYQTFTTPEGDVYRYNKNDPNSGPTLFHDQPEDPQKAANLEKTRLDIEKTKREGPKLETIYDDQGREVKVEFAPGDPAANAQGWKQVGGAKLATGWSITTDKEGNTTITQGAKDGDKTTESQAKKRTFAIRMEGAGPTIDQNEDALTFLPNQASNIPIVGNYLQSDKFRQGKQASREFLTAVLRGDSGGAITEPEEEHYGQIYIPQPGDDKQVLAQKRAARQRALAGARAGLTPQQIEEDRINAIANPDAPLPIATQPAPTAPEPGAVQGGFRYKGGNPADPNSWEPVGPQAQVQ